ncbi:MAG: hypothetical protein VW738_03845 [Pseudomonadales bacterium]|jgi:hypothetical protein
MYYTSQHNPETDRRITVEVNEETDSSLEPIHPMTLFHDMKNPGKSPVLHLEKFGLDL